MPIVSSQPRVPSASCEQSDFGVPSWVAELLAHTESANFRLITVRKVNAAALDPAGFEAYTRDAYAGIAEQLRDGPARYPVRFWNYIPDIPRPCGAGLDRYMCFNAGRFAACSDWLGGPDAFDRLLATGSGIGHGGRDLIIHALAASTPGVAVENARQIPAYRYSRRFGPRPPCFARATVIRERGGRALLLVGGTASIRGEESIHVDDLRGQALETFENLASLVQSADPTGTTPGLNAFRELRVYHYRPSDRATIAELVEGAFSSLNRVEYIRADLCRPELCIEIEGIAELKSKIQNPKSKI
jgi:chorismate lyase / 3-hydroxybenzoate synthase